MFTRSFRRLFGMTPSAYRERGLRPGGDIAVHAVTTTAAAPCVGLDAHGRAIGGPPREIYLTDPGEEPDSRTWRTQIVQPLATA